MRNVSLLLVFWIGAIVGFTLAWACIGALIDGKHNRRLYDRSMLAGGKLRRKPTPPSIDLQRLYAHETQREARTFGGWN